MSELEFEPGALVMLKSGGPVLTVCGPSPRLFDEDESVICYWYRQDVLRRETIPTVALRRYEPGELQELPKPPTKSAKPATGSGR